MYLFNNRHNRQHANLYGNGAFYDLSTTGSQAKVARRLADNLHVNETCIVASLDETTGDITFDWFRFADERELQSDEPLPCHAYFGEHFDTATLSRSEARRHPVYSQFFNVKGHFKRPPAWRAH
jgi:hypothetical protein